ncbi:MAG: thrombospondin type 3 repeat-containing protein, partial [Verrucomicrobiota bacterium]
GRMWITNVAAVATLDNMDTNAVNDTAEAEVLVCGIDSDGDGCSDAVELILGTNPADGTDCPATTVIPADNYVDLQFHSLSGLIYRIETTTNLNGVQTWQDLGITTGSEPFTIFRDTNGYNNTDRRYYRIFYPAPF